MKPEYANLLQKNTAKWRSVLLVDETGYANLSHGTAKWQSVLFLDETGLRQSAVKHCQVAVSVIGR